MAVKVARGVAKGAVGKSQAHSMSIEEGVKDIRVGLECEAVTEASHRATDRCDESRVAQSPMQVWHLLKNKRRCIFRPLGVPEVRA